MLLLQKWIEEKIFNKYYYESLLDYKLTAQIDLVVSPLPPKSIGKLFYSVTISKPASFQAIIPPTILNTFLYPSDSK